jgi:hypothetical protein
MCKRTDINPADILQVMQSLKPRLASLLMYRGSNNVLLPLVCFTPVAGQ